MPRDFPDEFVVFPGSEYHTVKLSVGHDGSRDPSWPNESGRQHRPAEPGHDALRYVEDVDECNTPGPGHVRCASSRHVERHLCPGEEVTRAWAGRRLLTPVNKLIPVAPPDSLQ